MRFEEAKFKEYLLYDLLVRRGTDVYYVYWVKEFFKKSGSVNAENWQERLIQFVKELEKQDAYQDWQGKQAEKAINLYFTGFKKEKPAAKGVGGSTRAKPPKRRTDSSVMLLNRFREKLRRQNCGAKAESIYLNWAELFLIYVEKSTGKNASIHSNLKIYVRRFFTYLEVNRDASAAARKQAFTALHTFFRLVFDLDISDIKCHLRFKSGEE